MNEFCNGVIVGSKNLHRTLFMVVLVLRIAKPQLHLQGIIWCSAGCTRREMPCDFSAACSYNDGRSIVSARFELATKPAIRLAIFGVI